jgi:hypothetical protein
MNSVGKMCMYIYCSMHMSLFQILACPDAVTSVLCLVIKWHTSTSPCVCVSDTNVSCDNKPTVITEQGCPLLKSQKHTSKSQHVTVITEQGCPLKSQRHTSKSLYVFVSDMQLSLIVSFQFCTTFTVTWQPGCPNQTPVIVTWIVSFQFCTSHFELHSHLTTKQPCRPLQWPSWNSQLTTKQSSQVLVDLCSDLHEP